MITNHILLNPRRYKMAEVEYVRMQNRAKDNALVIPLDELRTVEYQTKTFISGEFPGSGIYPIASGKVAFMKQAWVTNLSGLFPVTLKWADAATAQSGLMISGNAAIFTLVINSGMANNGTTHWEFEPALGPYTSGIIMVSGGCMLGGVATAIIQIDPQPTQ
jgi:hypothetical protein